MARLLDDIRADGKIRKPWFVASHLENEWTEHTRRVLDILRDDQLPVLLIDNVSEYFYHGTDQERWDLRDDFPNLAPPFPFFWSEHKLATHIRSKECGDSDLSRLIPHGRIGVLVAGLTRDQVNGEIPDNVRWVLWCEVFVDYGLREATADGGHGAIFVAVDDQGVIVDRPWMQAFTGGLYEAEVKNVMTLIHPTLLAVSFLHCKNVQLVDNAPPPKLAKRYRERHNGLNPVAYKTLVIEPLKQILHQEGRMREHGDLKRAMHICRGHFKDYRQGRGLFGKYHQLVWQPMVLRGSKSQTPAPREIEVRV